MLDDFDDVLARARAGGGDAFALLYQDLARPVAAYVRTQGVPDVEFCRLTSSDVVRHRLVGDIIDAYARWDSA